MPPSTIQPILPMPPDAPAASGSGDGPGEPEAADGRSLEGMPESRALASEDADGLDPTEGAEPVSAGVAAGIGVAGFGVTPGGGGVGRGVGRGVTPGGSGVGVGVGGSGAVGTGVGGGVAVGGGVGPGVGVGAAVTTNAGPSKVSWVGPLTSAKKVTECVPAGTMPEPWKVPSTWEPVNSTRSTRVGPACTHMAASSLFGLE